MNTSTFVKVDETGRVLGRLTYSVRRTRVLCMCNLGSVDSLTLDQAVREVARLHLDGWKRLTCTTRDPNMVTL